MKKKKEIEQFKKDLVSLAKSGNEKSTKMLKELFDCKFIPITDELRKKYESNLNTNKLL
jgi:hypothetical protein